MGHTLYHVAHVTAWYYFLAGPEGAAMRKHFGQRGWQEHFLARAELNRQMAAGETPEVDYSTWLKYTPKCETTASHTRITTVKHTPLNTPAGHSGKPLSAQPEAEESIHAQSSLSKTWNTSETVIKATRQAHQRHAELPAKRPTQAPTARMTPLQLVKYLAKRGRFRNRGERIELQQRGLRETGDVPTWRVLTEAFLWGVWEWLKALATIAMIVGAVFFGVWVTNR